MPERRVAELAPPLELLGEAGVVARGVAKRESSGWKLCRITFPGASRPLPAGELGDELKGPFLGAEVGQREPGVGVDDRRERPPREVVALGDHLGADEDGAVGSPALQTPAAPRLRSRVRVQQIRSSSGTRGGRLGLEPLCLRRRSRELRRPHDGQASGTARRSRNGGSADVRPYAG